MSTGNKDGSFPVQPFHGKSENLYGLNVGIVNGVRNDLFGDR
ncbi:LA_2272/LA_2273 family lipoprotein [Leptospira mayottensis]